MSERVFIVGAGQVGRGLFRSFRGSGIEVVGLHGRRHTAWTTSTGAIPSSVSDANTIILAVRDHQIDGVVAELIEHSPHNHKARLATGTVLLHTSGSAEPKLVPLLSERGLGGGTFHPLIPFGNPEKVPELLRKAWIGIDGDDLARAASRRIAGHIGSRTLDIPPGGKPLYHAAAVMSSNFPVVLAELASELFVALGVPERSAQQAVHGLMDAAVSNLSEHSPVEALTGPVVRGETETLMHHLAALRRDADARAVYKRLSLAALTMAAQRGVSPEVIAEMQRVLLLR